MSNRALHPRDSLTERGRSGGAALWLAVALAASVLASAIVALAARLAREATPQLATPSEAAKPARPLDGVDGRLHVGGSGSCIALVRRAVAACRADGQPLAVVVHEGIGSGGGLAALADGALDVALVSRTLKPSEANTDLQVVPYARSPVALATQTELGVGDLRRQQVISLMSGGDAQWQASGVPGPAQPGGLTAQWLLREQGDSSHEVLRTQWPEFARYEAAARQSKQAQVLFHDRTMHATLQSTPGTFGWVDAAAVRAEGVPLALPSIDGVAPDGAALAAGQWPWWKDQAAVVNGRTRDKSLPFLQCLRSPSARQVMLAAGALPAP